MAEIQSEGFWVNGHIRNIIIIIIIIARKRGVQLDKKKHWYEFVPKSV